MDLDCPLSLRHCDFAVKYIRKNRTTTRHLAHQYLIRKNQPIHPVLVGLGPAWFTERPSARDDRRSGRCCMNCSKTDVTLFKCSRCQSVNYWYVILNCRDGIYASCVNEPRFHSSRECQRADWKLHKFVSQRFSQNSSIC